MKAMLIAMASGTFLGFLDGLSATLSPDAEPMLTVIIISATVKGLLTGLFVALVAKKLKSMAQCIIAGGVVGLILSIIAAIPTGSWLPIVLPGCLLGTIVGFIVRRVEATALKKITIWQKRSVSEWGQAKYESFSFDKANNQLIPNLT